MAEVFLSLSKTHEYPTKYCAVAADPCIEFGPEDCFAQTPINPRFPADVANMFCNRFLLRPAEGTRGSRTEHGDQCINKGSMFTLSGTAVHSRLLEHLRDTEVPALLIVEVIRLRDLLRVLVDTPISDHRSIESKWVRDEVDLCTIYLPLLPYLRLLAQLRHVIDLLCVLLPPGSVGLGGAPIELDGPRVFRPPWPQ